MITVAVEHPLDIFNRLMDGDDTSVTTSGRSATNMVHGPDDSSSEKRNSKFLIDVRLYSAILRERSESLEQTHCARM